MVFAPVFLWTEWTVSSATQVQLFPIHEEELPFYPRARFGGDAGLQSCAVVRRSSLIQRGVRQSALHEHLFSVQSPDNNAAHWSAADPSPARSTRCRSHL